MENRLDFLMPASSDDIGSMIAYEYQRRCEERRREFVNDDNVISHIGEIAQWLCEGKEEKPFLVMTGGVGTGKTTLMESARSVLVWLFGVGCDILYRHTHYASDYFSRFDGSFPAKPNNSDIDIMRKIWKMSFRRNNSQKFVTANNLVSEYEQYDPDNGIVDAFDKTNNGSMLFIDDVGTEPETLNIYGTKYKPVAETLMNRYAERLPTVFTTNLGLDDLRQRYGDRVYDRLCECAKAIDFGNKSYRTCSVEK